MRTGMKMIIYGKTGECNDAINILQTQFSDAAAQHVYFPATTRDDLQRQLVQYSPDLVIVLANGAAGMEGVYASKEFDPDIPVFWFSDDHEFGMQSHRLECAYFSTKPLNTDKIRRAFIRCAHVWISI